VRPYKPVGCLECRHTGYRGRAGLYELLVMSEAARSLRAPHAGRRRAAPQAVKDGMRPLRLAGAMKVAEGLTTIEEVLRSTPAWSLEHRDSRRAEAAALRGPTACRCGGLTWKPQRGVEAAP
jgi:general secretion pathway protein E